MAKKRGIAKVDGNHILYHYLQKDLRENDIWLFQMLSSRLMSTLGIWLHPNIYQQLPVMLPFAVRDPSCRKRSEADEEQWGAPNEQGYFRVDNSLVKDLPRALRIESPRTLYNGKRIGNGFTAAHVWRMVHSSDTTSSFSTRNKMTYSFVPNLVWLPKQVGKLSDREDSFSQSYLQAVAGKVYRSRSVHERLQPYVDQAWSMLSNPEGIPDQGLPDSNDLNFFEPDGAFLDAQRNRIKLVAHSLRQVAKGIVVDGRVVSSRYTDGISGLPPEVADKLAKELEDYYEASLAACGA